ncbi:hypothetical protein B0H14DRAFT_3884798 [Mycena olivaceomarginata]|nr:hypothetical protein B0H14DRAFT_3884798 [Mycena olivaceomarginata]
MQIKAPFVGSSNRTAASLSKSPPTRTVFLTSVTADLGVPSAFPATTNDHPSSAPPSLCVPFPRRRRRLLCGCKSYCRSMAMPPRAH